MKILTEHLTSNYTSHQLSEVLIKAVELLYDFDRYEDDNHEYRNSPFGKEVREFLEGNLKTVCPERDFSDFGGDYL